MNKLSKEKRDQLILVAIAALAVCGALWYLVVARQNTALQKHREAIDDIQYRMDRAQRLVRRSAQIASELGTLRQQIGEIEAQMIPAAQLNGKNWILGKLANFIKDHNHEVTPVNLSNLPIVGKEFLILPKFDYGAAAYDFVCQAFYPEFGKFLADFENSFPYMSVQDLQMWPLATPSVAPGGAVEKPEILAGDQQTQNERLQISMRIVTLFKPASVP